MSLDLDHDDHPILRPMFPTSKAGDTIRARMLRWLALEGSVLQADFMREYHRRCERTYPSSSSFGNTYGLYVRDYKHRYCLPHRTWSCDVRQCVESREASLRVVVIATTRVIVQVPVERRDGTMSSRNRLHWVGPAVDTLLRSMSDIALCRAWQAMERSMQSPRASDDDGDLVSWTMRLRDEIERRRSGGEREVLAKSSASGATGTSSARVS